MSTLLSPFVTKDLQCPACRAKYAQRFFRRRVFVAEEKESDQHVLRYRWTNPRVKQVNPAYYFIFFCPHCFYADTAEDFSKPYDTEYGHAVLHVIKGLDDEASSVIDSLAARVNYEDLDFDSALCLHLLAIFIRTLPEEHLQDAYKMARLYLRVAWLFREAVPAADAPAAGATDAQDARPALALQIREGVSALERVLGDGSERCRDLARLAEKRHLELAQESRGSGEYGYHDHAAQLSEKFQVLLDEAAQLKEASEKDLKDTAAQRAVAHAAPDSFSEELRALLQSTRLKWDGLPMSEREALEYAIAHFQRAIQTDPRLTSHDAYYTVVFLVADLRVRCDDFAGALSMIRGIYDSGIQARKRYMEQLSKDRGLSESDRRRLQGRVNRVNTSLERTGDFRRQLIDQCVARELPRIREIVQRHPGAPAKAVEKALLDGGIPIDVLPRLREPGGPLEHLAPRR